MLEDFEWLKEINGSFFFKIQEKKIRLNFSLCDAPIFLLFKIQFYSIFFKKKKQSNCEKKSIKNILTVNAPHSYWNTMHLMVALMRYGAAGIKSSEYDQEMQMSDNKLNYVFDYVCSSIENTSAVLLCVFFFMLFCSVSNLLLLRGRYLLILVFHSRSPLRKH